MPLPKDNTQWPPAWADTVLSHIEEWSVWWAGTHSRLANYYTSGQSIAGSKAGQRNGVIAKAVSAFTGGGTTAPIAKDTAVTLHLPVAGDISRVAASLMYSNPPLFRPEPSLVDRPTGAVDPETGEPVVETVSVIDPVSAGRLDELVNNDRTQATLLAHEEQKSALGGGALRVVWDDEVDDTGPWIEAVDADMMLPEYTYNRLTAITFWTVYNRNDKVYRHFERYVRGGIEHALYEGNGDDVGQRVPLTELPELADLVDVIDENSMITFDSKIMAAVYVPNRLPNPLWRKNPKARNLGSSDYSNDILPLFAAIDEVWSSLMRDVRLGKGRLVVSESLLQTLGTGKGTWLDSDAEYLQRVGDTLGADDKPLMEQIQFAIREGAHLTIIDAILREILRRVGISPLTFGLTDQVTATTATEIRANTRDTVASVLAKRRLISPELRDLVAAMMEIDREIFGGPGMSAGVDVIWPPEVPVSDLEKAQTLTLLADSMSLYERVRYLHDDWDAEQIDAEVERIEASKPEPIADPFGFTEGPTDPAPAPENDPSGDTA